MQILGGIFMELKKQKWFKLILAMSLFMVMLLCTGLNVHAEDVKDGISATVSSDKENYSSEDEVKLKITVKNTNDFEVSDIKVENILPDGISLVSGEKSKDNINLQANNEVTMNLTVKKANSEQAETKNITTSNNNKVINTTVKDNTVSTTEKFPNTGENSTTLIAMIVMLISIVIMIVCLFLKDRKKYSKFLSVLICLGVINAFGITGIVHASSKNNNSFTYEYTYKINNTDYIHKIVISYNLSKNNNNSNTGNNNNSDNEKEIAELRKKAESTLNSIISGDYSKDFSYISMYGEMKKDKIGLSELSNTVMSNMKYKFNDIKLTENNKGAVIKCEFESIDMQNILYQLQKENDDNDEWSNNYQELILNKIRNNEYKTKKFNIDLLMINLDDVWYLYETPDFNDAITGGAYSIYTETEYKILNELEKRGN